MAAHTFLAVDLGASSGRVIAGHTDLATLRLEEVHRFENVPLCLPGGQFWDIPRLFSEVLEGLRRAVQQFGPSITSLAIDTWGCDFALLDAQQRLIGLPHQYRDLRHHGMEAAMAARISPADAYAATGVGYNFYNTAPHLLAEALRNPGLLDAAQRLLFIPDLLNFWLTGELAVERTIASTSQLLDPRRGDWAWPVIDALGLPRRLFGEVHAPGRVLGRLGAAASQRVGAPLVVVSGASHDTAAAVAAIPLGAGEPLWLSSGTWSIMGLELPAPVTSAAAAAAGLCNELGVAGSVRLLKNISGLWLIQECRRHWQLNGQNLSYAELAALADQAEPFRAFIDPEADEFSAPGDLPARIRAACARTGQPVPESIGAILRVATDSLALKYRHCYERFCALTGRRFGHLHLAGGGIQNAPLNQAIADALGIPVSAGPVEATSCGNILTQLLAHQLIPDIHAGRQLVANSFPLQTYLPHRHHDWNSAYQKFCSLLLQDRQDVLTAEADNPNTPL